MKLTINDMLRLRLSQDINFSYFTGSFKDFNNPNPSAYGPNYYRKESEHLGFIEEDTSGHFGFEFDGKRWSSTHRFYQPWQWNNNEKDNPVEMPWVLFFMGNDDFSFFKRFYDVQALDSYWDQLTVLHSLDDLTLFN